MADITLFELHFHGGIDVGPASIGAAAGDGDDAAALDAGDSSGDESSGSNARKAMGAILAVVLLVILGVGVKKLLSDDLEPIEELDELDDET
jgi:hypothetical protein